LQKSELHDLRALSDGRTVVELSVSSGNKQPILPYYKRSISSSALAWRSLPKALFQAGMHVSPAYSICQTLHSPIMPWGKPRHLPSPTSWSSFFGTLF